MRLSTIGYEGSSLADLIDTLTAAGIERVIDIRAVPQSRRPGFSKSSLSAALAAAGIAYEHQKRLGDPKPGRDAARAGNITAFVEIFTDHLAQEASREALREVAEAAAQQSSVLLCYERDPKHCHRALVGQKLSELHSFSIKHLGVRPGAIGRGAPVAGASGYASAL